jgi:hypothetical protein
MQELGGNLALHETHFTGFGFTRLWNPLPV